MPILTQRLLGVLVPLLVLAGCGGGGGGGSITFTVIAVNPAVSTDLNGGDIVTITGTNFMTAAVSNVTFDGTPGTDRQVLSETELTVRTPPAPFGIPGAVIVTVISLHGGQKQLINGYTYADSPPAPQTITPTTFTPTGAEDFTISGTTLGPLGGQVTVAIQGVGSVTATVSLDGNSISGRAPVSVGVPPVGPLTVTVNTGSAMVNVPTPVNYAYTSPTAFVLPVAYQTAGNASQPVRLADGYAIVCTSGGNTTWGDGDDDIKIISGPPIAPLIQTVHLRTPPAPPATSVGYLSAGNSIPAVLGPDTFCVFSIGAGGGAGFILVTNARTAPVADFFVFPGINAAPIAAIGPSRIAFMHYGADLVFGPAPGNMGDDLLVQDLNLGVVPPTLVVPATVRQNAGIADVTTGPTNFSIPFSADGDTVFVIGAGADGLRGNGDDTFFAYTISTTTPSGLLSAPFQLGRPIAISATLCAGPAAGGDTAFGTNDDALDVFAKAATWSRTPRLLGQALNTAFAVVPSTRIGNGVALAVTGPNAIKVFTAPAAGTNTQLPFTGTPLLATLGNLDLVAFGPGGDLIPAAGADDQSLHLDAAATLAQSFSMIPNQLQTLAPLTDTNRVFALSPGLDLAFGTGDDTLEVYQSRSLGQLINASALPVTRPLAPVTGAQPFVPIGPSWGILQSPGANGAFLDGDDQLIVATY